MSRVIFQLSLCFHYWCLACLIICPLPTGKFDKNFRGRHQSSIYSLSNKGVYWWSIWKLYPWKVSRWCKTADWYWAQVVWLCRRCSHKRKRSNNRSDVGGQGQWESGQQTESTQEKSGQTQDRNSGQQTDIGHDFLENPDKDETMTGHGQCCPPTSAVSYMPNFFEYLEADVLGSKKWAQLFLIHKTPIKGRNRHGIKLLLEILMKIWQARKRCQSCDPESYLVQVQSKYLLWMNSIGVTIFNVVDMKIIITGRHAQQYCNKHLNKLIPLVHFIFWVRGRIPIRITSK